MREIKFRAWLSDIKKMIYDAQAMYDTFCPDNSVEIDEWYHSKASGACNFDELLKREHVVVEQFTGLYDENGKEVYEGDVMRAGLFVSVVEWFSGSFITKTNGPNGFGWCLLATDMNWPNCVVIGNIHENPELLEVAK